MSVTGPLAGPSKWTFPKCPFTWPTVGKVTSSITGPGHALPATPSWNAAGLPFRVTWGEALARASIRELGCWSHRLGALSRPGLPGYEGGENRASTGSASAYWGPESTRLISWSGRLLIHYCQRLRSVRPPPRPASSSPYQSLPVTSPYQCSPQATARRLCAKAPPAAQSRGLGRQRRWGRPDAELKVVKWLVIYVPVLFFASQASTAQSQGDGMPQWPQVHNSDPSLGRFRFRWLHDTSRGLNLVDPSQEGNHDLIIRAGTRPYMVEAEAACMAGILESA